MTPHPRLAVAPRRGAASALGHPQTLIEASDAWIDPELMVRAFGWDVREKGY